MGERTKRYRKVWLSWKITMGMWGDRKERRSHRKSFLGNIITIRLCTKWSKSLARKVISFCSRNVYKISTLRYVDRKSLSFCKCMKSGSSYKTMQQIIWKLVLKYICSHLGELLQLIKLKSSNFSKSFGN